MNSSPFIIDDNRATFSPHKIHGDAFSFDSQSKLIVCGGHTTSYIIDTYNLSYIYKEIPLKYPKKCPVTSYEWEIGNNNKRYLQNRDKISELIDIDTKNTISTYSGHSRSISEAKWSPLTRSVFASSSLDSYVYIWSADQQKPVTVISSVSEVHCLGWSKLKEFVFAVSSHNDIKIYDWRKANSALKYIPNAHNKKIYCIDWCPTQDKFLTCSVDKYIRLWSMNPNDSKYNQVKLDDFQCWKAKFFPYGICFAAIPACQSSQSTNSNNNKSLYQQNSPSINNSSSSLSQIMNHDNQEKHCSFLICQIDSPQQVKINRYFNDKIDMIMNFDFNITKDKVSLTGWTKDRFIVNCTLESSHLPVKEDSIDVGARISILTSQSHNVLQHCSITSNSSRKSSMSECGAYGTPPTHGGLYSLLNTTSITSADETTPTMSQSQQALSVAAVTNSTLPITAQASKSYNIPHPLKSFGAKFSGVPDQLLVFTNQSVNSNSLNINQTKPYSRFRRTRMGNIPSKVHRSYKKFGTVYIFDLGFLIPLQYNLGCRYKVNDGTLNEICEYNYGIASKEAQGDIAKIWELISFITATNTKNVSMNPDHGRPWSSSTFGRPLVNYLIESCLKINDIQTAVMIISKLIQHDMDLVPIPATVNRRQHRETSEQFFSESQPNASYYLSFNDSNFPLVHLPSTEEEAPCDSETSNHRKNVCLIDLARTNEFDYIIKFYCDILYRWGLHIKRAELYEFIHEKPTDFDKKFECPSRCSKCANKTTSSRCLNCKTYLLYCSLCQLPVNGLSTICFSCGHGGHHEHMIEWFKKHDECAAACGCRCQDYL